jgi:Right handed beta helix region
VYVDAVNFGDKAVSVKGAGQGRTIIKAPADLPAPGESDPCAGAGLCWSAPDGPVKVRDRTTVGHANGILGQKMDGMLVARTSGRDHAEYGIAAFESHRLTFVGNTERGDGGEAGIYIGDTDDADAKVAHNTSTGWTFGFFFRDSRVGTAWGNKLARNCIGALVLDTGPNGTVTDPQTHQQFTNHPAGAWWLVGTGSSAIPASARPRTKARRGHCRRRARGRGDRRRPRAHPAQHHQGQQRAGRGRERPALVRGDDRRRDEPGGLGRPPEGPGGQEPVPQRAGHLLGPVGPQDPVPGQSVPDLGPGGPLRLTRV